MVKFTCVWIVVVGDDFAVGAVVVTVVAAAVVTVVAAVAAVHLAGLCMYSQEKVLVYCDDYFVAHEPAIHSPVMYYQDKAHSLNDVSEVFAHENCGL